MEVCFVYEYYTPFWSLDCLLTQRPFVHRRHFFRISVFVCGVRNTDCFVVLVCCLRCAEIKSVGSAPPANTRPIKHGKACICGAIQQDARNPRICAGCKACSGSTGSGYSRVMWICWLAVDIQNLFFLMRCIVWIAAVTTRKNM